MRGVILKRTFRQRRSSNTLLTRHSRVASIRASENIFTNSLLTMLLEGGDFMDRLSSASLRGVIAKVSLIFPWAPSRSAFYKGDFLIEHSRETSLRKVIPSRSPFAERLLGMLRASPEAASAERVLQHYQHHYESLWKHLRGALSRSVSHFLEHFSGTSFSVHLCKTPSRSVILKFKFGQAPSSSL